MMVMMNAFRLVVLFILLFDLSSQTKEDEDSEHEQMAHIMVNFIECGGDPNKMAESSDEARSLLDDFLKTSTSTIATTTTAQTTKALMCPKYFDSILCWKETPAGQYAYQQCPEWFIGFQNKKEKARFFCLPDGTWEIKKNTNHTYTDYTACIEDLDAKLLALIKETFWVNSLGFPKDLIPEHQSTNRFVMNPNVSHWECKSMMSFYRYAESSNHATVFSEALYLNALLSVSTFNDNQHFKFYIAIGWVGPLIWITPFVCFMALCHETNSCWNSETSFSFFYVVPQVLLIFANFALFINVLRILKNKLRKNNLADANSSKRYKKLAKSTLLCGFSFSIYYIAFSVWQPFVRGKLPVVLELIRLYFEIVCGSFQGLAISCIYCFCNSEVQHEIIIQVERKLMRRNPNMRRFSEARNMRDRINSTVGRNNNIINNYRGAATTSASTSTTTATLFLLAAAKDTNHHNGPNGSGVSGTSGSVDDQMAPQTPSVPNTPNGTVNSNVILKNNAQNDSNARRKKFLDLSFLKKSNKPSLKESVTLPPLSPASENFTNRSDSLPNNHKQSTPIMIVLRTDENNNTNNNNLPRAASGVQDEAAALMQNNTNSHLNDHHITVVGVGGDEETQLKDDVVALTTTTALTVASGGGGDRERKSALRNSSSISYTPKSSTAAVTFSFLPIGTSTDTGTGGGGSNKTDVYDKSDPKTDEFITLLPKST